MTKLTLRPMTITNYDTGERIVIKRKMNLRTKARLKNKIRKALLLTINVVVVAGTILCSVIALGDNTEFATSVKCIIAVYAMMIFWILPFGYANKFFR